MKNIFYLLLLCFCFIISFSSCSDDDESPFVGNSNKIVSFSLTIDGVLYKGAIEGKDITISVPSDIDLSDANVEYTLCENSTILPDPKSIDNWNDEQVFRIQAYNNEYTSYKCSVVRSDIVNNGNVTLLTQSDVDAFGTKKINLITGNLIIGQPVSISSNDNITNLNALKTLTQVNYNVVINNSYNGENLEGLSNLKQIGGLYIGSLTTPASSSKKFAISLPMLESSGNIIAYTDSLTSFSTPKLISAGNIYINSINLKELNLSALTTCTGDMTIKAITGKTYSEAKSNQLLTSISIPYLHEIGGTFCIENFWKLKELNLSYLQSVAQDLQIKYLRTIEKISLPELKAVGGAFNIQANDGMETLSVPKLTEAASLNIASVNTYSINLVNIDLSSFETTAGDFVIQFAGAKTMAFENLKKVGGKLQLSYLQFIKDISIPSLEECSKINLISIPLLTEFNASNLEKLTDLTIQGCTKLALFKSPKQITGNVTLHGNNKVCDFTLFKDLERIEGILSVTNYYNTEITLSNIKYIGSYTQTSGTYISSLSMVDVEEVGVLTISGLTKLTSFSAPKLKTVNNFSLKGSILLTNIELPLFTKVTGSFTFYGGTNSSSGNNCVITDLNAFKSLSTIGKVDINYASQLCDFSGLKNAVETLSESNWTVKNCKYNPTFQNMVDGKYTNE